MGKKSAFSLAETLIAVGTVGVVALLMISTMFGDAKASKIYKKQFDKINVDVINVSKIVLYEDCMWGEKLSSFTPFELRDAFASRMHINNSWNRGNSLKDGKETALSFLNVSKNYVPGVTLRNGATIGFVDDELLKCSEQHASTQTSKDNHKWSLIDYILWLFGLGPAPGSASVSEDEEISVELSAGACLSKKDIKVDDTRSFVGLVLIDVNGQSSPNKYNNDQYIVPLYDDGF